MRMLNAANDKNAAIERFAVLFHMDSIIVGCQTEVPVL